MQLLRRLALARWVWRFYPDAVVFLSPILFRLSHHSAWDESGVSLHSTLYLFLQHTSVRLVLAVEAVCMQVAVEIVSAAIHGSCREQEGSRTPRQEEQHFLGCINAPFRLGWLPSAARYCGLIWTRSGDVSERVTWDRRGGQQSRKLMGNLPLELHDVMWWHGGRRWMVA